MSAAVAVIRPPFSSNFLSAMFLPRLLPLLLLFTSSAIMPLVQSAPSAASNGRQLSELIGGIGDPSMASAPQLLDRNAFRMSFGKRAPAPAGVKVQKWPRMDENSFRMSFGKRSGGEGGQQNEMLTHANIPIPLLFDLADAHSGPDADDEPMMAADGGATLLEVPPSEQQKNWPPRWRARLFRKRLDRNLFNVGFGRR